MKHLFIISLIFVQITIGQELKPTASIPLTADTFVGIDSYTNYYFIKDGVFHKQGPEGTFVFNDYLLGKITSVDIINPLKIILFYEDVNMVVLLDNKLNEMERINFNTLADFINIGTATNAGNNSLWVFNIDTQQLELFNYRTKRRTTVSQPFAGKLISQASNFNYCFILTENKLRKLNLYGSMLSERNVKGFEKIVMQNEKLIGLKGNMLFFISENSVEPIKIPLPENTVKDLQFTQDLLYIYNGINILTFSLTQPKQ